MEKSQDTPSQSWVAKLYAVYTKVVELIRIFMSYDQSHLDRKYFIDTHKYNCPFCNRRSITYSVTDEYEFDWGQDRRVYGYIIECGGDSCNKKSMHLANYDINMKGGSFSWYLNDEDEITYCASVDLDSLFFYHQPTTFFTLDNRINDKIRRLVAESEGCAKMNYLVGASGCLRKAIYELLEIEKVPKKDKEGNSIDYGERIKILKEKYPAVPAAYFDALANIQGMASEQLHEGDWRPWTPDEFRFLVETVKEILTEVYVRPQEKNAILDKILGLKPQKLETQAASEEGVPNFD